jgi:hypothetical protein
VQWFRVTKTYEKPHGGFLAIGPRYPGMVSADGLTALFTHPGDAQRPLATEERYQKLLEVADRAKPEGRLRLLLTLARHTGRRINALANLRASYVLLSSNAEPHLACGKTLAGRWLTRAEKLAEVPKLARGAWHPFRRSFASPSSRRRHHGGRGMAFVARHARELPALGRTGYAQCRRTLRIAPEAERKWHKRGTGGSEVIACTTLHRGGYV